MSNIKIIYKFSRKYRHKHIKNKYTHPIPFQIFGLILAKTSIINIIYHECFSKMLCLSSTSSTWFSIVPTTASFSIFYCSMPLSHVSYSSSFITKRSCMKGSFMYACFSTVCSHLINFCDFLCFFKLLIFLYYKNRQLGEFINPIYSIKSIFIKLKNFKIFFYSF